jgi:pimeloyl-ACP methyl ester carboxylesterase
VTFVLVHGGGFDARCWARLTPLLDGDVFAVDLPGRGTSPADLANVTVTDFVERVTAEIVDRDLTDVVLVGHSLAGITLPGVAARVPDRLARLVFVSCVVPPHGRAVSDVLETLSPAVAEVAAGIGADAISSDGTLHRDLATVMFCNDMDAEQRAETLALLVPEALGVISEPVDLDGLRRSVPTTSVRLLRDASLTPDAQDRMARTAGASRVVDLDSGHMAMISRPDALAEILNA